MNFPWPRIWSIACPTFPASATKAMPHTRSASSSGTRPAIPAKSNEAPVACPSWIYNNRNRVERLWARLKEWRAPLRENRQILHGRPLPCRHLRLDQERRQAITGPKAAKSLSRLVVSIFIVLGSFRALILASISLLNFSNFAFSGSFIIFIYHFPKAATTYALDFCHCVATFYYCLL